MSRRPPTPDPRRGAPRRARRRSPRRLEVRRSIDDVAQGAVPARSSACIVASGLAVKLAWDRWGVLKPGVVRKLHAGPAALPLARDRGRGRPARRSRSASFLRARRLAREEDALFARYRALRGALGLDP